MTTMETRIELIDSLGTIDELNKLRAQGCGILVSLTNQGSRLNEEIEIECITAVIGMIERMGELHENLHEVLHKEVA